MRRQSGSCLLLTALAAAILPLFTDTGSRHDRYLTAGAGCASTPEPVTEAEPQQAPAQPRASEQDQAQPSDQQQQAKAPDQEQQPPEQAERPEGPVSLRSDAGRRYVGHQLEAFETHPDGSIGTRRPAWISLYRTEDRPFKLTGKVRLTENAEDIPRDTPHGFGLFIREWSSLRRYTLSTRGLRIKRRRHAGETVDRFKWPIRFTHDFETETWYRFEVVASANGIKARLGKEVGTVEGPLDTDGANKLIIYPGARLKDLKLEVLDHDPLPFPPGDDSPLARWVE